MGLASMICALPTGCGKLFARSRCGTYNWARNKENPTPPAQEQTMKPSARWLAALPAYLFVVLFMTLFVAIPAFIFFRDRKKHLIGELLLFAGVFGLLIPNLVIAIHRS